MQALDALSTVTKDEENPSSSAAPLSKFVSTKELVSGELRFAAGGLAAFMCVEEHAPAAVELPPTSVDPCFALENEVKALGNDEVTELLDYILRRPASEKDCPNGRRDVGHVGMRLHDFVQHQNAVDAKLIPAHIVALRLYTTAAYREINNPLRDLNRFDTHTPHPLPVTVWYITDAIKRLRRVATDLSNFTLWRGMKGVHVPPSFLTKGGCELAPMYVHLRWSGTKSRATAEVPLFFISFFTCISGSWLLIF